jgi:hypothetical protein
MAAATKQDAGIFRSYDLGISMPDRLISVGMLHRPPFLIGSNDCSLEVIAGPVHLIRV